MSCILFRLLLPLLFCLLFPVLSPAEPFTLAVSSDLHIQRSTEDMGLVNPLVPYNSPLADALLWDAAQHSSILVLTGDLTNQGRTYEHELLLEKLRRAKAGGLSVYVLPGNHDIGDVTTDLFAQLYTDFGYGDAYSRDDSSLSYSILCQQHLLILLDTGGYGSPSASAGLSEETLLWAAHQLQIAKAHGWPAIVFGHYPLLTPHSTTFTGREEAIALLEQFGIPLYLCGHLHGRSVTRGDLLTELAVDQPISSPCCYAILEQEGDCLSYRPQQMDIRTWARETGSSEEALLNFDTYAERLSTERWHTVVENLASGKSFTLQEIDIAAEFFMCLLGYRASGMLYDHTGELLAHPGYPVFLRIADGTIYSRWIPSVLQNAEPYSAGFILSGTQLQASGARN